MDTVKLIQDTIDAVVDCYNWINENKIPELVASAKSYLGSLKELFTKDDSAKNDAKAAIELLSEDPQNSKLQDNLRTILEDEFSNTAPNKRKEEHLKKLNNTIRGDHNIMFVNIKGSTITINKGKENE